LQGGGNKQVPDAASQREVFPKNVHTSVCWTQFWQYVVCVASAHVCGVDAVVHITASSAMQRGALASGGAKQCADTLVGAPPTISISGGHVMSHSYPYCSTRMPVDPVHSSATWAAVAGDVLGIAVAGMHFDPFVSAFATQVGATAGHANGRIAPPWALPRVGLQYDAHVAAYVLGSHGTSDGLVHAGSPSAVEVVHVASGAHVALQSTVSHQPGG
jgi:hypothetical protein